MDIAVLIAIVAVALLLLIAMVLLIQRQRRRGTLKVTSGDSAEPAEGGPQR